MLMNWFLPFMPLRMSSLYGDPAHPVLHEDREITQSSMFSPPSSFLFITYALGPISLENVDGAFRNVLKQDILQDLQDNPKE